jgi:hypothetical protein
MKKLIGIILAVCMLGTMASAATVTGEATASDLSAMTVSVTYAGIADGAQATLLAYKVADTATADAIPAYVDEETTPIVGIDQEVEDGAFTFKVADTFRGKIAVKVGGTDVDAPAAFLVEFVDAPEEPEGVEITLLYGDVNGDGEITNTDAGLVLQLYVKLIDGFTDQQNREIPKTVGDVNGDGEVTNTDAGLVLQKYVKLIDGFEDQEGNALTTYTYTYVAPEA